jgi:hypothetical protein
MSDEKKRTGWTENFRNISGMFREIGLTLLLITCLFHPAIIKNFLTESGLSELGAFGFNVKLKEEKEKVELAQEIINETVEATAIAVDSEPQPERTEATVDPNFKATIVSARRVAPDILPTSGWVYLGRVNEEKSKWFDKKSAKVIGPWPIEVGDTLTLRDDVYVREKTADTSKSQSRITSMVKVGDKLQVVEIDFSHAKNGGFFVWAKAAILIK